MARETNVLPPVRRAERRAVVARHRRRRRIFFYRRRTGIDRAAPAPFFCHLPGIVEEPDRDIIDGDPLRRVIPPPRNLAVRETMTTPFSNE